MGITYDEKKRVFKLDTPNTTYCMCLVDQEGFLSHAYYGKKLADVEGVDWLTGIYENPFTPEKNDRDRLSFMDCFPNEYSSHGVGDYRESSVMVQTVKGYSAVSLVYDSHTIYTGKKALKGLPASFDREDKVTTLEITLVDKAINLKAHMMYSVFEDTDVIARSIKFENIGRTPIILRKAMSMCMDMENRDFDMITLHGSWARERRIDRRPISHGKHSVSSLRGESGHQEHPFLAIMEHNADQKQGEVYGFSLLYSGNFRMMTELNQFNSVRVTVGIEPEDFSWKLGAEEFFQCPEVLLTFSSQGIGEMTRSFHRAFKNHIIRSPYRNKKRPILINNWEATYFDFNEEKLLQIAQEASKMGIEMLVMDDGWFGNRFDDNRALGDWVVNEEKIKGGLGQLVDKINELGMEFGIWFEPEMISPESELYKEHPEWAIHIPDRTPGRARNQFVLDIGRKEVRNHILQKMFAILHSANIRYVKWDMNRPLSDLGSVGLPSDGQSELCHRYVLGMYEMQEALLKEFPDLLLENCSGGGARFDGGMLYYSPQIWCSDDTDAIERLRIQESTSMVYPLSTMGAHVSVCPNHSVGRTTPFDTRGYVALTGTFGYELDVTKLSAEEKKMVTKQTQMYHQFNDLVREGEYYRIASYQDNHIYDCYMVNKKDMSEALLFFVQVMAEVNSKWRVVRLQGLKPDAKYRLYKVSMEEGKELLISTDQIYSGALLMNGGLKIERQWGDFRGQLIWLKQEEE